MSELVANGIIGPMIFLMCLGWFVPQVLARAMPEGVGPLMILAGVATIVIWVTASAFFYALYVWKDAPLEMFSATQTVLHFGRLGLLSGLLWAPIMILSVANLPRHWTKETW